MKRLRLRTILLLYRSGLFRAVDSARDWLGYHANLESYSQFGEDRFILDFFAGKPGAYIDVGAFHPWRISNTYLLYRHGWRGVTVEPILRFIESHRRLRPRDVQVHAAVADRSGEIEFMELVPAAASTFSSEVAQVMIESGHGLPYRRYRVPVLPVTDIYRERLFPERVDLLTIDVEGFGLKVLQGIDFAVLRPRLIVMEMNADAEDAPMRDFLRAKGYSPLRVFGCNEIFQLDVTAPEPLPLR